MAMFRHNLLLALVAGMLVYLFAAPAEAPAQDKPVFTDYKGVTIGMDAADARGKLGKAKDPSDTEDYYEFSDDETARVLYDENKKVRAISVTFNARDKSAPTPQAVIGKTIDAKPDGGMFKMVEYPKNGFWISYVRTGGDEPLVIVTVQKMVQ